MNTSRKTRDYTTSKLLFNLIELQAAQYMSLVFTVSLFIYLYIFPHKMRELMLVDQLERYAI